MAENGQLKFRRVLLKLSGEGLLGKQQYGIDPETVDRIASEIKAVHDMGAEVCMVIGGGHGTCHGRLYGHVGHHHERTGRSERA